MKSAVYKVARIVNSMVIKAKSIHVTGRHVWFPGFAVSIAQKYFEIVRAGLRWLSMPQKWSKMVVADFVMI
jgi:hypothetical protein